MSKALDTPTFGGGAKGERTQSKRLPYILLVDDDPDQLFTFKTLLESTNHNVITANSAEEAAAFLKDVHVDLVITDINMPKINGKTLVRSLRAANSQSYLPVITFSADASHERGSLEAIGADAHCDKASPRSLVKAIDKILGTNDLSANLLAEIQTRFSER